MLVIDANIAIKLVAIAPGRNEALARIDSELSLTAPDWLLIEAGHALWRKVKFGLLNQATAQAHLATLPNAFDGLISSAALAGPALKLSFELNHWVYDCLYLACALHHGAPLLTSDRKFWNAAKRGGYDDVVELLTWPGRAE